MGKPKHDHRHRPETDPVSQLADDLMNRLNEMQSVFAGDSGSIRLERNEGGRSPVGTSMQRTVLRISSKIEEKNEWREERIDQYLVEKVEITRTRYIGDNSNDE